MGVLRTHPEGSPAVHLHRRARTTPLLRAEIARSIAAGTPVGEVGRRFNISRQTAAKWARRFAFEGFAGLHDRSSAPHRRPTRIAAEVEAEIERLRRERRVARQIGTSLSLPRSTVGKVLRRLGLPRLASLEPPPPPAVRYEHETPGDLVHIDIKKLARIVRPGHRVHGDRRTRTAGAGWEYVYVCVDDASRAAFVQIRERESREDAAEFLKAAAADFASRGVRFARVMTDNGKVFRSFRFGGTLDSLGARQVFTRPYRPQTNGKAERFIRTMLGEWAYAYSYEHSQARRSALSGWLRYYNEERPHHALKLRTPAQRLLAC